MDAGLLRLTVLLVPIVIIVAVLVHTYYRMKRKARTLRASLSQQRRDALRSVTMMIRQMEYDAEVLQLMRHARASNERRNETDFNAARDRLVERENGMLSRVDGASQFEDYLARAYEKGRPFDIGGQRQRKRRESPIKVLSRPDGDGDSQPDAGPEQVKEDIRTFIRDLERIRGGELDLLDEKISFFEPWVEGPERKDMLESLKATALFLEKGDASELEKLKKQGPGENEGSGVRGRGLTKPTKKSR